jgi:hypothetical protein
MLCKSKAGLNLQSLVGVQAASTTFQLEATALATKLEQRAEEGLEKHPTAMVERFSMASCGLQGCVFVGHTNTDMDSVASAIGAAKLYKGTAARSAAGGDDPRQINGEILHALEFSGLELPPFFQDLPDAAKTDGPAVCFVDTNHPTQMISPMNTASTTTIARLRPPPRSSATSVRGAPAAPLSPTTTSAQARR